MALLGLINDKGMDMNITCAIAGTAAATLFTTLLWKTYESGRKPKTIALNHCIKEISSSITSRKTDIAFRLAELLKMRTVSFEYPDGKCASLIEEKNGGKIDKPAGCGGCACNRHAIEDATGKSSTEIDSRVIPTPEALETARRDFLQLHGLLEKYYPKLHSTCEKYVVNKYSLVYVWRCGQGKTFPAGTQGICLAAHMDVVPVPDASEWKYPPFDGRIEDGYVHGRGAIDDKQAVIGICEAVETLLTMGLTPNVPYIALAFGHDEEIGGTDGAKAIADVMGDILMGKPNPLVNFAKNVPLPNVFLPIPAKPFSFILDEGLFLLSGFFPGHDGRVAVVCIGEKGHVNVELKVELPAGHSSVPPDTTSIGVLSKAIVAMEKSKFPVYMDIATTLFKSLLAGMSAFPYRFLFANLWLFSPLIKLILLGKPASAALLRTTKAVTMSSGGLKSNVLPPSATAIVNHRIHPRESVQQVIDRDREIVQGVDPRVQVRAFEELEPAPVSSTDSFGYSIISASVRSIFGSEISVAPGLMLGNTDTRHYWSLADDIYRHCPTELTLDETKMFHGRDEKISIDNLARIAVFYASVMINCGLATKN